MSSIVIGVIQFLSSLASSVLIDRLGRRVLLSFSIIFCTVTLFSIGTFFFIQSVNVELANTLGWLPLTSLCVYMIAYPSGYGGIPWVVLSEVAPLNFKAFCSPAVGVFGWSMAFLVTLSFNYVTALLGIGPTFWLFGSASILGTLFTLFVVPETKGKSLAEIQELLNKTK
jgi:SP family facilitated glucose transporter-like MFS transporter 8